MKNCSLSVRLVRQPPDLQKYGHSHIFKGCLGYCSRHCQGFAVSPCPYHFNTFQPGFHLPESAFICLFWLWSLHCPPTQQAGNAGEWVPVAHSDQLAWYHTLHWLHTLPCFTFLLPATISLDQLSNQPHILESLFSSGPLEETRLGQLSSPRGPGNLVFWESSWCQGFSWEGHILEYCINWTYVF